MARCAERFNNLQTLQSLCLTLLRAIGIGQVAQLVRQIVEVKTLQQVINGLCTHLGDEFVRIRIIEHLIFLWQTVEDFEIFFF